MNGPLPALPRSRAAFTTLTIAAVALAAFGFVPLFAGPGYESSLAAGLVLPSLVAVATSLEVVRYRPSPRDALVRGLTFGALFALLGYVLALLHGLRVGMCGLWHGSVLYALGPAAGALLAGGAGAVAGLCAERVERRRLRTATAIALGLALPVLGIVVSLGRFYTSPMVFAHDPFFGFFSGSLYDTVIDPRSTLLSYRFGSLCSLLALAAALEHVRRDDSGRLRLARPSRWLVTGAGVVALAGSLGISAWGDKLGHYSTTRSIEQALGARLEGERCELVYSRAILLRDARATLRDCEAHVRALERYFEAKGPPRIKVFLFASPGDKGRLMGAANTYIAKPWRAEVYLQAAPYPHPVLAHELAHVVAGSFGRGPFKVAGLLGGLLPDPGRIEGVAVAAAPPDFPDLTLMEWARAMLDLELLPELRDVFRLTFLAKNSSTAYTVAGAFMEWLRATHGPSALTRWYQGEPLAEVVGEDLSTLEAKWREALRGVRVSEQAMHTARARFDRPSVFQRRCPHEVDLLEVEAGQHVSTNEIPKARERYQRILALDPQHLGAQLGLASCAQREGDTDEARRWYRTIAEGERLHWLHRAQGLEALGDMALREGRTRDAVDAYAKVAEAVVDEDRRRALAVKSLPTSDLEREAIVSLLIGDVLLGPSFEVAAAKLGEWHAARPDDGLPPYLLGKNFYARGRWQEAAAYLDRALELRLDLPLVAREAWRSRLIVACALEDHAAARRAMAALLSRSDLSPAQREGVARLSARCGMTEELEESARTR